MTRIETHAERERRILLLLLRGEAMNAERLENYYRRLDRWMEQQFRKHRAA